MAQPDSRRRRRVELDPDEDEDIPLPAPALRRNAADDSAPPRDSPPRGQRDDDDIEEQVQDEGQDGVEQQEEGGEEEEGGRISEDEGEDLLDNLEADYVAIPELDTYDIAGMDQREYAPLNADQRRRADDEIERRGNQRSRLQDILDRYGDEEEEARERRRGAYDQRRLQQQQQGPQFDMEDEEINLEAYDVPLREWIAEDRTRRELKRRFRKLLEDTKDSSGRLLYGEAIRSMCSANLASLEVDYQTVAEQFPTLALWLLETPHDILVIFDEVANEVVLKRFPYYRSILKDDVHVRITGLPVMESLRSLRQTHLNHLVRVVGVVTKRTQVFPQIKSVTYECAHCKGLMGPFNEEEGGTQRPDSCTHCTHHAPLRINQAATVYRNYQRITLQETPGTVPAGRVPRYKEVILTADLIDRARPGEEIEVTGIYRYKPDGALNQKNGFPVFSTCIEANYIHKREDLFSINHISDDDKAAIHSLANDPKLSELLLKSFAPSIHGHNHVKLGLLLALFGGVEKNIYNKHRIRGDINVLLLGDPGTAKSQFLKYLEKIAPRAVYTTGKGASAVGLTAGVHKDPVTKEWTLEGGALVLADRGMCLIDEFDKMNDGDRTSIHEALEQQSISVSKAGIVTSLQARCSVVAAANPIGGRYDSSLTFAENVELTDPILQRLDILCVLQDIVDPIADERLADFVVGSHQRSHPAANNGQGAGEEGGTDGEEEEPTLPQRLLTKYIMYARSNVSPQIHDVDQDKVARLYADLRRESTQCGGVPIAVRHIESIIRMSEAHAKMHLRDHVRDDDVNAAISVMLHSFLQAQKFSVRTSLERGFRKYMTTAADFNQLVMAELQKLLNDHLTYMSIRRRRDDMLQVPLAELEERAKELRIHDLSSFLNSDLFKKSGLRVETIENNGRSARVITKLL